MGDVPGHEFHGNQHTGAGTQVHPDKTMHDDHLRQHMGEAIRKQPLLRALSEQASRYSGIKPREE